MAPAPRGLRAAEKRLSSSVLADFELDESASVVLAEAAHTVDLLTDLRSELAETPAVIDSAQGQRVYPLLVEIRQQRLALAKLIASLGLPKELTDGDGSR